MQRALDGLGEILRRRQPGETQVTNWSPGKPWAVSSGYVKIAIENGPFIVDLPMKNGDFP